MSVVKNILICFILAALMNCGSDGKSGLFAIPYFPELDITMQAQTIAAGPVEVAVDTNRPVKPFQHQYFRMKFSENSGNIKVSEAKLAFNMKMDMGRLIYIPELKGNEYVSDVQLPKCISGDTRWYGKLDFKYKDVSYSTVFLFDIQ